MTHQLVIVMEKIKQGKGNRSDGWWCWVRRIASLHRWLIGASLSDKVTSGPRPEGCKGASSWRDLGGEISRLKKKLL